ncbi:hypothetical protein Cgig2_021210 [Carnegiea gigantea]|uniref:Uncharacterized protein n=1 Tax=Carnegiea gigantea TaxID=171969 RepID=A0A9Q1KXK0_9CARY|nr:hypothetical protein Cgig2_021210 [Carnegiea gigantea]
MNEINASRSSDIRPTGKDAGRIAVTSSAVETATKTSLKEDVTVAAVQGSMVRGRKPQQIRRLLRGRHQQEQLAGLKGKEMRNSIALQGEEVANGEGHPSLQTSLPPSVGPAQPNAAQPDDATNVSGDGHIANAGDLGPVPASDGPHGPSEGEHNVPMSRTSALISIIPISFCLRRLSSDLELRSGSLLLVALQKPSASYSKRFAWQYMQGAHSSRTDGALGSTGGVGRVEDDLAVPEGPRDQFLGMDSEEPTMSFSFLFLAIFN